MINEDPDKEKNTFMSIGLKRFPLAELEDKLSEIFNDQDSNKVRLINEALLDWIYEDVEYVGVVSLCSHYCNERIKEILESHNKDIRIVLVTANTKRTAEKLALDSGICHPAFQEPVVERTEYTMGDGDEKRATETSDGREREPEHLIMYTGT